MSTEVKQVKGQVVYNGVQCLMCGKTIESTFRHDYKRCGCPNQAHVDGGLNPYVWTGARDNTKIRRIVITDTDPFSVVRKFAFRMTPEGKPVRLYKMSDEWLSNAIEYCIDKGKDQDDWHTILLIKEKQYRTEKTLKDEEDTLKAWDYAVKTRLSPEKELTAFEKEEEVIRFSRVRTERGLPRP